MQVLVIGSEQPAYIGLAGTAQRDRPCVFWKPAVSFGRVATQCKASGTVYCDNLFHRTVGLAVSHHRAVTGRHHHVTSSCNTGQAISTSYDIEGFE